MNSKYIALICGVLAVGLGACSGTKETLGLTKTVPDEFKVVKRAPLAMPPEYNLRPPRAGAPRPQEQTMSEEARQTVFGMTKPAKTQSSSSAEDTFLKQAGADTIDPNIREKVSADLADLKEEEQPIGTRLLGIGGDGEADADVVDAIAESKRIQAEKKAAETQSLDKK